MGVALGGLLFIGALAYIAILRKRLKQNAGVGAKPELDDLEEAKRDDASGRDELEAVEVYPKELDGGEHPSVLNSVESRPELHGIDSRHELQAGEMRHELPASNKSQLAELPGSRA